MLPSSLLRFVGEEKNQNKAMVLSLSSTSESVLKIQMWALLQLLSQKLWGGAQAYTILESTQVTLRMT